jgi:tripartite-type tricarboxylate transporter receptor subunit TctC
MKFSTRFATAALLSVSLGAVSAQAQDMLEPLEDGFPNRPIVLMVIDSPGSVDSLFASQIAEAASKISPQPVIVEHREDFTNFGTWEGIAWIKDQGEIASEGYITYVLTVPDAQVDMAALDIESMTGQTMEDLNPVFSAERVPYYLIQRADAPWGNTIEDLIAYAQANPGEVRHITGGPGGGQDAAMRYWAAQLNIPMTDVIGGNPQERALAVASGEGDITASPPDVLGPHYDAGRVNLLLGAGNTQFPEPWQDVPPSETLFDVSDPFSQTRTIATSPDVPDAHRDWLYTLYSTAAQDPDYIARREQVTALEVIDLDPAESMALAESGLEISIQIFKDLGIYWADQ